MCRFVRDGEPDIGEYRELADGTGICVLADMNGPESGPLTPAEAAERMARTDFIIEEYENGIIDENEAGSALFHHLFPNEH